MVKFVHCISIALASATFPLNWENSAHGVRDYNKSGFQTGQLQVLACFIPVKGVSISMMNRPTSVAHPTCAQNAKKGKC